MIWGCFVNDKFGPLIQVSGSITGSVYIKMLEYDFLPFYNSLEDDLQYIFQDNNASVHKAKVVKQCKEDNLVLSLP